MVSNRKKKQHSRKFLRLLKNFDQDFDITNSVRGVKQNVEVWSSQVDENFTFDDKCRAAINNGNITNI